MERGLVPERNVPLTWWEGVIDIHHYDDDRVVAAKGVLVSRVAKHGNTVIQFGQ